MDLDSLIDTAAPPVAPRTQALTHEALVLVDESRPRGRSPRRRLRIAVVCGVSVAAIGATAATTAAVAPSAWTSWLTGGHKTCQLELSISPAGPDVGDGEPNKWPAHIDYARRQRMIEDAKTFVADFDYAGIDHQQAIRAYRAQEAKTIANEKATEPAGGVQPAITGTNEVTASAISAWVLDRLEKHLDAEGYDMSTRAGSDLFLMWTATGWVCK